jgi:acyl carrier protein
MVFEAEFEIEISDEDAQTIETIEELSHTSKGRLKIGTKGLS